MVVEKFKQSGNENRFSLDTRNIRKETGVGGGEGRGGESVSFSFYAACRLTSFNNFFYPIRGLIIYSFINKQTYLPWRRVMFHSSPAFCACAFYLLYFGLFSNFFSKDGPRRTVFRKLCS